MGADIVNEICGPVASEQDESGWYARLVQVTGRVHEFWRRDNMLLAVVDIGGRFIKVEVGTPIQTTLPEYFEAGATVRVTGALVYTAVWGKTTRSSPTTTHACSRRGWIRWKCCRVRRSGRWAGCWRRPWRAPSRERLRLSHDLHDGFQQLLASCSFSLAASMMALEGGKSRGEVMEWLKKAEVSLQHTQTGLRATLWAINEESEGPSRFSDLIRYAAARLAHWKGLVHFTFAGKEPLVARRLALSLLMVMQEAVANAIRHGGATGVDVAVRFGEKQIEILITDNGRGFDASAPVANGGMGIASMRQRVAELRGTFRIESRKGSGTTIAVRFPA